MIYRSQDAEASAVLNIAQNMCAAARTAPKTKGLDYIDTCIVTGDELEALAKEMEHLAKALDYPFFVRDADCVRKSQAVVLIGSQYTKRGLGEGCGYCNFKDCKDCGDHGAVCVYDPLDLGLALGSAVSVAADSKVDSRIMFSVGRAAMSLGLFDTSIRIVMGIPVSVSGKSPFFDRG